MVLSIVIPVYNTASYLRAVLPPSWQETVQTAKFSWWTMAPPMASALNCVTGWPKPILTLYR